MSFVPFMERTSNLEHLQKKKIVIGRVFPKLQNVKDLDRPLSKLCRFRTSFDSQHVKESYTLVKSPRAHFYYIFLSLWGEMIRKISPLMKFQILEVFVNTFTADYKYPVPDCENLPFPI